VPYQKLLRIFKGSCKQRDHLFRKKEVPAALISQTYDPSSDKRKATLVLYTINYNLKNAALPEDEDYKKLSNNPNNALEQKTVLLKRSSVSEEICQQLKAEFKASKALTFSQRSKRRCSLEAVSIIGAPNTSCLNTLSVCSFLTWGILHAMQ
jgi:hypothetical protein